MAKTTGKTTEMENAAALDVLGQAARATEDNILVAINKSLDSPLRIYASVTPDAKLNFTASQVSMGNGTAKSVPANSSITPSFVASWIDWQAGTTNGGTFSLTFPDSIVGKFRRCAFTLLSSGTMKAAFSAEVASLGSLADPGTLYDTTGQAVGWIDLECTAASPGRFKTAGSSTSIIENSVSGTARIVSLGAGGGVGSSTSGMSGYQFVAEIPEGSIDGSNVTFIASFTPLSSIMVVLNGLIRRYTDHFTVSGKTITFDTAPSLGSDLIILYGTQDAMMQSDLGTGNGVTTIFASRTTEDLVVTVDGAIQRSGVEYMVGGAAINFLTGYIPGVGQILTAEAFGLGNFAQETLSGAVGGGNQVFTFSTTPSKAGAVLVTLDGKVMKQGATADYTISGATVTFVVAPVVGQVPYGIRYTG